MSRITDGVCLATFNVTVAGGIGYGDFLATGKICSVIVTAPNPASSPAVSWVITDAGGRGILGGSLQSGPQINWPSSNENYCKGRNRLSMSGVTIDGVYAVALYGASLNDDSSSWSGI